MQLSFEIIHVNDVIFFVELKNPMVLALMVKLNISAAGEVIV